MVQSNGHDGASACAGCPLAKPALPADGGQAVTKIVAMKASDLLGLATAVAAGDVRRETIHAAWPPPIAAGILALADEIAAAAAKVAGKPSRPEEALAAGVQRVARQAEASRRWARRSLIAGAVAIALAILSVLLRGCGQ